VKCDLLPEGRNIQNKYKMLRKIYAPIKVKRVGNGEN
jgi:hypothetical protein